MAGLNAGGRVAIKLNNDIYHPVGDVEIEPTGIAPEEVTNQDGTVQRTVTPKPYRFKLKIRDSNGLDIEALYAAAGFDATVEEIDMQRNVLMTNAFCVGAPNRNTQNGEITEITVVSHQYKVVEKTV